MLYLGNWNPTENCFLTSSYHSSFMLGWFTLALECIMLSISQSLIFYGCINQGAKVMKPWQTLLDKAPGQGGKKERRKKKTQVQARSAKTQKCHKEAKEQIMFQSSHQLQEAYQRRKGKRNLKNTINLEESSPEMIARLKIETACIHTNIN